MPRLAALRRSRLTSTSIRCGSASRIVAEAFEQLVARSRRAPRRDQASDECALGGRQVHAASVRILEHPALLLEEPRAAADRRRCTLGAGETPMQRAKLRGELARIDRLGEVRIGAAFEAAHARADVAMGREHDDADAGVLAQEAREREPALALDVDDDEIAARRRECVLESGDVCKARCAKVRAREPEHEALARDGVVADDVDRRRATGIRKGVLATARHRLQAASHRSVLGMARGGRSLATLRGQA